MSGLKLPSIAELSTNEANSADPYGALTLAEFRGVLRSHLVMFGVLIGLAFIVSLFLARPIHTLVRDHVSFERTCCDHEPGLPAFFGFVFKTGLNIGIAAGLLLSYYLVLAFVSPRLTRTERRHAYGSLPLVVLFFLFGSALLFFVALPRLLEFLDNLNREAFTYHPAFANTASLYGHISPVIGSVFELIFIMYMLARLGIVSPRQMSASRRYAVVAALLTAAVFTLWPLRLDMVLLVAGVIYALYEVGIIFAKIADRRRNPLGKHSDDRRYCDFFEVMVMAENRDELRSRLVKVAIGFALAFIAGVWLTRQLVELANISVNIGRTGLDPPPATIADFFRTGLSFAVAFSIPMIYYEVIAFAAPILTRKERRNAYGSLPLIVLFFLFAAFIAFFVALPRVSYRTDIFAESFAHTPVEGSFRSFNVQLSLAIGSACELIVIMYLLARLGIASPRFMSACRRFAVVIAILAAAFVTLQPFSRITVFVAAGLYLLYEVGIVFAKVAARRRNKQSRHDNEETLALAG